MDIHRNLKIETIVEAKLKTIEDWGMFFEYGQNLIFIQVSEVQWNGLYEDSKKEIAKNPLQKLLILKYVQEKQMYLGSLKQAHPEGNPWKDLSLFQEGNAWEGRVSDILEWGTFVELIPGVKGLIADLNVQNQFQVNDTIQVIIDQFDKDTKKITLSLKVE